MNKSDKDANYLWEIIKTEAQSIAKSEPYLDELLAETILSRLDIFDSIASRIARKLGRHAMGESQIYKIFKDAFAADSQMRENVVRDIVAIKERDPACTGYLNPILYFKGFHAITTHRAAHWLWNSGHKHTAYYFQSLASEIFAVDIHPAARFGGGILLDHATAFVAGETSVVEDNVSIRHEVTLGGTGKESGDRHPKIMSCVFIGAGAKIIGNIKVGKGAKVGAGSVVLDDVPPHTTVVGVPARIAAYQTEDDPARGMNEKF